MTRWVEIEFDCLPLRSVGRLDAPIDASPGYHAFCERIKQAMEKHGLHNTYYLYNGKCLFHLLNHDQKGLVEMKFEGVVLTDATDAQTAGSALQAELARETCDWLTEPVTQWFRTTVSYAVEAEFDRYIDAGDLEQAKRRMAQIEAESDDAGGYLGMYL